MLCSSNSTQSTTPSCLACSCFFEGIPLGDMDQARENKGESCVLKCAFGLFRCGPTCSLLLSQHARRNDGSRRTYPNSLYECKRLIGTMKLPLLEGQPMHVYGHFEGFVPRTHCFGWQYKELWSRGKFADELKFGCNARMCERQIHKHW